jgi:hypothetical protein
MKIKFREFLIPFDYKFVHFFILSVVIKTRSHTGRKEYTSRVLENTILERGSYRRAGSFITHILWHNITEVFKLRRIR